MAKRVARVAWDLILTIGEQSFNCADFSWSFSLNQVPTATATLAVGRDIRTLERARVHTEEGATLLANMSTATVTLVPRGHWAPEDVEQFGAGEGRWDEAGNRVIFEGYLTGTGYTKQRGAMRYTVSLIHWLADLHFSSALSNQSHPSNPSLFRWRSVFGASNKRTSGLESYFVTSATAIGLFESNNIQEDFWGRSLHQLFCDISSQDVLDVSEDKCGGHAVEEGEGTNAWAQDALKRIECNLGSAPIASREGEPVSDDTELFSEPPAADIDEEVLGDSCEVGAKSPYHVPLRLRKGNVPGLVAEAIGLWCKKQTTDSFFNTTIWDKIVGEIGPQFEFAVVPKIRTAQIIPFCPGLRHTYGVELDLADMTSMNMRSSIPRPLRAVGVTAGAMNARSNALADIEALAHAGACYSPDQNIRGMVKFVRPPQWLAALPSLAPDPDVTTGGTGGETTPATIGDNKTKISPAQAVNAMYDYYQRYAHATYVREMLRGRGGVVSGKVRFDIAPGTTVKIRNQDPLHIAGDAQSQNLVGEVIRVTGVLSAEARKGSTSFQIAYLRTESENESDATSVDHHPLYEDYFKGAPLLHAYKFD